MARNKVVVITTGGTIAMRDDGAGAQPALSGTDLVEQLPQFDTDIEIEHEVFSNIPSSHLTTKQLWQLQKTVSDRVERLYVRGAVITHGTDTLEETAYLLDYTIPSDRAIVVTGAMHHANQVGYDGLHNLASAIRVAVSPEADERGTMVVLNGEIHAARYVTKFKSHGVDAFQSPGYGPMGRIIDDKIHWNWNLDRDVLPVRALESDVHLLTATVGMPNSLLRHLIDKRVRGIVIEGFGGGRVPPWWMEPIREAAEAGVVVVVATRSVVGQSGDSYNYPGSYRDLEEAGVVFAEGISGPKARIKLMAALGGVS